MAEQPETTFADLLRRLRLRAGLTQEELAEAATVSSRTISDLERGLNQTARKDTARLLADALSLSGQDRIYFDAIARGRAVASLPHGLGGSLSGLAGATQTLPRDIASFVGREQEFRQITDRVAQEAAKGVVDVYVIGGMAGIGKTAFAVRAAHRLAPLFPDGQIFLSLHGHTAGQLPVDPVDALGSLLQTIGIAAQQVPSGLEQRARLWRDHLARKRLLIVLDDAIGHEQVRPMLPGTPGTVVLITSRKHMTALEDVKAITLDTPTAGEAAEMLSKAAARSDLDPGDPAVAEIVRLCGYLPLAIGMTAGQLRHHPAWTAADLSADIAAVRDRLAVFHTENLSVATAFDMSYRDLTADQQRLFRLIGLHPGADIDVYAAAALAGLDQLAARGHLEALYEQHLLAEPRRGRYLMHDLIREHARFLAAMNTPAERDAALTRMFDYYLHCAGVAGRHLARRSLAAADRAGGSPTATPDLTNGADAVAWLNAERLNLQALTEYASLSHRPAYATAIPAALHGYLRAHGHWDQALAMLQVALGEARRAGDKLAEAGALADLADIRSTAANHAAATVSAARALELYREAGSAVGEANALHVMGSIQQRTGDYAAATATLNRALQLHRGLANRIGEASVLNSLGSVQYRTGDYGTALVSLALAMTLHRELGSQLGEVNALNELGVVQARADHAETAIVSLTRAVELHRKLGNRLGVANAHRDLGAAQGAAGDYQMAADNLRCALSMQRELGNQFGEANAHKDLGIVHWMAGSRQRGAEHLEQAREIYRELGASSAEADVVAAMGDLAAQANRDSGIDPAEREAHGSASAH